jgi:hypothetical protein
VHSQTNGIAPAGFVSAALLACATPARVRHAAPSSRAAASSQRSWATRRANEPQGPRLGAGRRLARRSTCPILLLISRMASATTGAFLSAARTICGKAAGRMDGEFTLLLIAVTAVWSILLEGPPPAGSGNRRRILLHKLWSVRALSTAGGNRPRTTRSPVSKDPVMEGRSGGHPPNLFKRRIRDA